MQVDYLRAGLRRDTPGGNGVNLRFIKTKMFASTALTGKQSEKNSACECNE